MSVTCVVCVFVVLSCVCAVCLYNLCKCVNVCGTGEVKEERQVIKAQPCDLLHVCKCLEKASCQRLI